MASLPAEISDQAQAIFDDVPLANVDPEAHADFVIARVLERGTLPSVAALLRMYGRERIRAFFLRGGALQLSRRTVPLWLAYLDLEAEECTPKSSPRRRSAFWVD
jgi:hypothetical protein